MKKNMTMLILSCDAFSDLWDGNISLLERNWSDRDMKTIIVTDESTNKYYQNVAILNAGKEVEWNERLLYALSVVDTDFVFITLDDYYLIKEVDDSAIKKIEDMMIAEHIDYLRLFPKPTRAKGEKLLEYPGVYMINTSIPYSVNLYSGIWRKSFLETTIKKPMNAWRFEVSLARCAKEDNAKCAVSYNNEFVILDVVRKGKLLHNAARYFEEHPGLYNGNRPINTWRYEISLGFQIFMADHIPYWAHKPVKKIMNIFGKQFYSDQEDAL